MVRPEVEPGVILLDLIADFVPALDAIILPLLAVLDAVGPMVPPVVASIVTIVCPIAAIVRSIAAIVRSIATIVRSIATIVDPITAIIGAVLHSIGAISRHVAAVTDRWSSACGRATFATAVMEEFRGGTAGNSRTYGRAEVRTAGA